MTERQAVRLSANWFDEPGRIPIVAAVLWGGIFLLSFVDHTTLGTVGAAALALTASLPVLLLPYRPRWAVAASLSVTFATAFTAQMTGPVELATVVVLMGAAAAAAVGLPFLFTVGTVAIGLAFTGPINDQGQIETSLHDVSSGLLYGAVYAGLAVAAGHLIHVTRSQGNALLELERERRAAGLQAERQRIARELHDVAAHHLAAAVVKTKTAERVQNLEGLREANAFVGRAAEESLLAMRQIVGMLRSPEEGPPAPQPRWCDLEELLRRSRDAGLEVNARIAPGLQATLDRSTELSVVRIAQESFANVLQHSGSRRVDLEISRHNGDLVLLVDDAGVGLAGNTEPEQAEGYGLMGMRERARALGGSLETTRSPLGGWRIEARLPLNCSSSSDPQS